MSDDGWLQSIRSVHILGAGLREDRPAHQAFHDAGHLVIEWFLSIPKMLETRSLVVQFVASLGKAVNQNCSFVSFTGPCHGCIEAMVA